MKGSVGEVLKKEGVSMDPTMRALRVIAARQAALGEQGFTKAYVYALTHGVYPLFSERGRA